MSTPTHVALVRFYPVTAPTRRSTVSLRLVAPSSADAMRQAQRWVAQYTDNPNVAMKVTPIRPTVGIDALSWQNWNN